MRKVLENSMHNLIPLDEELTNIKLYLDLEQVRFENKFVYFCKALLRNSTKYSQTLVLLCLKDIQKDFK